MPIFKFKHIESGEEMEELFQLSFDSLIKKEIFVRDVQTGNVMYVTDGKVWILQTSHTGSPKFNGTGFYATDY